jgi:hypothetical protein
MSWTQCKCVIAGLVLAATLAACGSSAPKKVPPPSPTVTVTTPNTAPAITSTGPTGATSSTGAKGTKLSAAAALTADQAAETLARTASSTAEAYATNKNGSYAGLTPLALHALTPSIQTAPGDGTPYVTATGVLGQGAGYTLTVVSTTGDTFSIGESATGTATESCTGTASTACTAASW